MTAMPKTLPRCLRSDSLMVATFLALAVVAMPGARVSAAAESSPNVVLILADDLGWSDTTLFGTTRLYQTPNIERLAARGMTFTHAYSSSPLCSPTRASILTGLSPARTGITSPACHLPQVSLQATEGSNAPPNKRAILPNTATRFDTQYYTLAEALKDNGYATGHFGKWHLGPAPYSPLEHGFDVDVPHWPGPGPAGSYVAPWKFPDFDPNTPDEHIEDRMAMEAVAFLETHRDEPFFLNYWMFSVHAPFDAKQSLIDDYRTRIDPNDPQRCPTYAAMIESMDDAVGTLLDTLDRLQIADNTIIIFASDNGGNMYNEVDGTTPTSNAPLRGGKATMYEGGVRGPAVVVYPSVIEAASRSEQVIQSSDFYPTLLEILSIAPQAGQTFDGISIMPAFHGNTLDREAIFTYFPHSPPIPNWLPPAVSVHRGDWKLIRIFHGGQNGKHRWKLFNLREDLGEQHDLADRFPERVQGLDALIEAFLADTDAVLPIPNPSFDPTKYRPELEGKGSLKGGANAPKKSTPASTDKSRRPPSKPGAGWQPSGTCELAVQNGSLVVNSTGGDPYLSYESSAAHIDG
jgi:arylsulfatase A-like enzyme